jgi:hypothetical protein
LLEEVTEIPVMDSRVVTYRRGGDYNERLVTNKETLISWFPDIFENEDARCNYFALSFGSDSFSYYILSQNKIYVISPGLDLPECDSPTAYTTANTDVMLICDNTDEKNLSSKINVNSTTSYADPNWNCATTVDDKGVFF